MPRLATMAGGAGLLLCLTLTSAAQPPSMREARAELLAWKFKPKDRFIVETNLALTQIRRAQGFPVFSDIVNVNTVSTFTVKSVADDGTVELEQKIDGTKLRFDGTNRLTAASLADSFGRMQGSVFQITLGPDGKVQALLGYDEMIKRLAQVLPADRLEAFRRMLTEEDLKNATEEGFAFLPEGKVKPGDEWTKPTKLNLSSMGVVTLDLTYKLESLSPEGRAKIKVSSKAGDFKATAGNQGRPDFTIEDRSGTVVFDTKSGRLVSSDIVLKIRGNLLIPNPTNVAMMVNLDVFQQNVVKITLKDRPAK